MQECLIPVRLVFGLILSDPIASLDCRSAAIFRIVPKRWRL
jgi:hypothetical protein